MSTIPYELDLRIAELIRNDRVEIPPYPAVAMKLNQMLLENQEYGAAELVAVIEADQMLAASVLRYVNSPALRPASPITSLRLAVARLGRRDLLGLALAVGIGQAIARMGGLQPLKRMVWRNALFCAELCRQLASRWCYPVDEAFSCGLLHDFGKVVAIACLEQIIGGREEKISGGRCIEVVETYHVEVGRMVAERWNLPDAVAEVIACHHQVHLAQRHQQLVELVATVDETVALMETVPRVTEEHLEQVSALPPDDREFVAGVLVVLPLVALSFEPTSGEMPPVRHRRPSMLIRPQTTLEADRAPWPVDHTGTVTTLRGPVHCRATYLSSRGVGLRAPVRLHEQSVVELGLDLPSGSITLWSVVTLCVEETPGFRIEVHPLGLDPEASYQWQELLARLEQG